MFKNANHDLIIRGGTVADGLGGSLREADVAITGDKITAVGSVPGKGVEEIDARGLLVTPGFVDVHTHYDGQSVWDSYLTPSSLHGVTTAVMGNCGVGFAPVKAEDRETLINLMEGVEDIPGAALHEGLDFNWHSFKDYIEVLGKRPRDVDLAAQLPHAALRVYVMGNRALQHERATSEDIAAMRTLAAEAIRAGAVGFSTSRTIHHRSIDGNVTPTLRATEDELLGIAMGLKDAGRGVLQYVSDWDTPDRKSEFDMVRRLVVASGRPLSFTLSQRHNDPDGWKEGLALLEQAHRDGLPIRAQVAPRPAGVLMGLQGSQNPFSDHPSFKPIAHLPLAQKLTVLRNPEFRRQLLSENSGVDERLAASRPLTQFNLMFPFDTVPNYEPGWQDSVAAIAKREGRCNYEVALDLLLRDDGLSFLFVAMTNYAGFSLDACRAMIAHPLTVPGLGDGGAHVSYISDANFPTFLLSYWGRDRGADKFELSELVKRQSSDTARMVGLNDRGVIMPGMKGDLNIIDFDRLSLRRPSMLEDLPAGGKRLMQGAHGYVATILSGEVVRRNGESTGKLPGRVVKST
ncbi:amidohydrolase family protein [Variovorax sp. J31P207]|uniref:N-acyl-D-amino-acid deacylase family protein n=1 Tax=Variovorax sp. J31P207 TaxID=3053510 RepID=UPI002576C0B9|nr:amidohydrolase family protein [Variovorax sp. J31P207]MDM0069999.1 amidohydrolase family protein [Variovorax sp. J31P207]